MTDHHAGETVRITATIVDTAGSAADPTTVVASVAKPDGTAGVTDQAMTKSAVGSYYYDYTAPTDAGIYTASVKATGSGGRITIEPDTFGVVDAI